MYFIISREEVISIEDLILLYSGKAHIIWRKYLSTVCKQLLEAQVKIYTLQQHVEVIRGDTVGFILEQMNTLHIETKEFQL